MSVFIQQNKKKPIYTFNQLSKEDSQLKMGFFFLQGYQKLKEMSEQASPKKENTQSQIQAPEVASPPKAQLDTKREDKKKKRALIEFLSKQEKQEGETVEVQKKQEEVQQVKPQQQDQSPCKICGSVSDKKKQCQFCKDTVCLSHLRKKRKLKNSNKFARICDDCEDTFIYDKYKNSESKAEQALAMQEMIIQTKRNEIAQLVAGKRTKHQMLINKKIELEDEKKDYDNKVKNGENDINNKLKKITNRLQQQKANEDSLQKFQQSLPRPLDDDHNCLIQQNTKITKQLVKYEKLCAEALKAKSTREKDLYEMYYKWQQKQTNKAAVAKKKEECVIY